MSTAESAVGFKGQLGFPSIFVTILMPPFKVSRGLVQILVSERIGHVTASKDTDVGNAQRVCPACKFHQFCVVGLLRLNQRKAAVQGNDFLLVCIEHGLNGTRAAIGLIKIRWQVLSILERSDFHGMNIMRAGQHTNLFKIKFMASQR